MEQASYYKYCMTPQCKSTTITTPHKVFIRVPPGTKKREKWLRACRRDPKSISASSRAYVCEDHFNLETDMENFMKFKMVGGNIKIKDNVVPHIFDCQNIRKTESTHKEGSVAVESNILKGILESSLQNMPSTSAEIQVNVPEIISYNRAEIQEVTSVTHNFGVMVKPHVRSKGIQCRLPPPQDPFFFTIQYGSIYISETFDRTVQVSKIVCNDFSLATLINDAAVLVLENPIPLDFYWEPVRLSRDFDTSAEQSGIIIGWGRLWADGPVSPVLQKLEVEVYPDSICGRNFDITQHVCFGAQLGGACNGDSGTSLIVDGKQVAIASFITAPCGIANRTHPNVYSKVTASLEFIDNVLTSS